VGVPDVVQVQVGLGDLLVAVLALGHDMVDAARAGLSGFLPAELLVRVLALFAAVGAPDLRPLPDLAVGEFLSEFRRPARRLHDITVNGQSILLVWCFYIQHVIWH
jgi:hypothetical protein